MTSEQAKRSILLSFEEDDLLELRKILFRKGLSPQEFFAHIVHKCVMRDNEVETLYEGALAIKQQVIKGGTDLKDVKLDDVDALYDAIEQNRQKGK